MVSKQNHLCIEVAEHQILGGKHFLIFLGPEPGKTWGLKKVQYLQKKVPLPVDPPAWRETQVDFLKLGNLSRPLELIPASREREVPAEWQVRTVLGDCMSRAKSDSSSSTSVSATCADE